MEHLVYMTEKRVENIAHNQPKNLPYSAEAPFQ